MFSKNNSQSGKSPSLVMILIILIPFALIYNATGAVGLTVFVFVAGGGFIWWKRYELKKDEENFNKLALFVLYNPIDWREGKALGNALFKSSPQRAELIRSVELIRDSIDISLKSKVRDTAISRMKLVLSMHKEIRPGCFDVITEQTLKEIDCVVADFIKRFNTDFYITVAKGHIEKAATLKTQKSKTRYLSLAYETVQEGLSNPYSNKTVLEEARLGITELLQQAEVSKKTCIETPNQAPQQKEAI